MHELYTGLSGYYDAIYESIEEEINFVEELFRKEAEREVRKVLDLHEEMLVVAGRKAQPKDQDIRRGS